MNSKKSKQQSKDEERLNKPLIIDYYNEPHYVFCDIVNKNLTVDDLTKNTCEEWIAIHGFLPPVLKALEKVDEHLSLRYQTCLLCAHWVFEKAKEGKERGE